jgi:copper oxidase (laccase) domain-containing protein
VANDRGRWQADLYELARRRLTAIDVTGIHGGGYCTFADKERFFSYRRNPDCGRMVSFVAIKTLENTPAGAI